MNMQLDDETQDEEDRQLDNILRILRRPTLAPKEFNKLADRLFVETEESS